MNVIFIMNDTFRADHLGCYGNSWVHTPHLDRLSRESAIFDRAYISSYPTVPNRWDLATGRFGFPYRGWRPMDPSDIPVAQILSERGYNTMLVHDTPMLSVDDFNYTRGFEAFRWVHGHHWNMHTTDDPEARVSLPAQAYKLSSPKRLRHYIRTAGDGRHDRDFVVARSVVEAIEWLEENHHLKRFLLWLDLWDPHEPFDPPWWDWERYREPTYRGERILYPAYGRPDYMTGEELKAVRALYAGKVTMVDRWVGRLLETVEMLGLLRNTLIIWTTDHGHFFGEHHLQGKPAGELGNLYEETAHIPMLVRHPQGLGAGKRVSGLVQPPDVVPTILDFLEVPVPPFVQGKSVWPLVNGDKKSIHKAAFSCRFPESYNIRVSGAMPKAQGEIPFDGRGFSRTTDAITVTTERWAYVCAPADRPSELYDLAADPKQQRNVIQQHPQVERGLRQLALDFLKEHGAPPERLRAYLDGVGQQPLHPGTTLWGFRDEQGLWITFTSEEQARACLAWDAPGPKRTIQKTTLGRVADDNPKNLVRMWQYYWAQDLA